MILSGGPGLFKDNFENRRVPAANFNADQTVASMLKLAELQQKEHAQLWINHDKAQRDTLKMAPQYYE